MYEKICLRVIELTLKYLQTGGDISEVDEFVLNWKWPSFRTHLQFNLPQNLHIDMFVCICSYKRLKFFLFNFSLQTGAESLTTVSNQLKARFHITYYGKKVNIQ